MDIVRVHPLFKRRALVTRASTDLLRDAIAEAAGNGNRVALDLTGIDAITPSFIDQVLQIVEGCLGQESDRIEVLMLNPPSGLSSRLEAIGRAHHSVVTEDEKGNWIIPVGFQNS